MYCFTNDYNETAHPALIEALLTSCNKKNNGYGLDNYCDKAADLIKEIIKSPHSHVHFLSGGTITNLTFISHVLRPYQAVIAAETGHVAVHETGAIEATGHKVITIKCDAGKLTPDLIKPVLDAHCDEHMVQPKLVYLSNTTELGTLYTKYELQQLAKFCKKHQLYLYLDGARLAMALTAKENDLSFSDLPKLTDAFYIGGTKVGAFAGEALIINNDHLNQDFRFSMKQKGAIMAKSWILGCQFLALFQNGLYLELGKQSNDMADELKSAFEKYDFHFAVPVQTNQLFVNVPDKWVKKLSKHYDVLYCGKPDTAHTCLRFCTSWATQSVDILRFAQTMKKIHSSFKA